MLVPVTDLTKYGVIRDVEDYLLPPNAWTDSRNVRLHDGRIERMGGSKAVLDPPSVAPYWLLHTSNAAKQSHWLYAGLTKVYTFTSGAHTDISRAVGGPYAATADGLWNGGLLPGIPVINNSVDAPQMWNPVSAATPLAILTNWPATDRCAIIRAFKNYLFALDMTVGGTRFPHRLKISHPADPGSVPSSWDETDPTKDVISRDIGDEESYGLVDAVRLGSLMMLYKDRSTHYAQFIGGTQKWKTDVLFDQSGLLADHCCVAFAQGRQHFLHTGDDVIVHNGQERQSVLEKRDRRWLLSNMDTTNYGRSFCVHYAEQGECWFCFPGAGATWPNLALVYNFLDGDVTFRELDAASFIAPGQIPLETSDPWDSDAGSWDSDTTPWDELAHQPFVRRLLQAKPDATKLFHLEATSQFNGVDINAYVERTGLDLIGMTPAGEVVRDQRSLRIIRGIWLNATGQPIQVQVAIQAEIGGSIAWQAPQTFTPGVDEKVEFDEGLNTRLFGVRFSMPVAGSCSIQSYRVDVEPTGQF